MDVFLCIVFLIMPEITVITTTNNPPVTFVCFSVSPTNMTVMMPPTSAGLTTVSQHCGSGATVDPKGHNGGFF